ncbi:thioesterase family protein [Rhodoferax sp. AJA081-3]|uniref:thioesterase family protein n=1 Tax=Rhodoferax sp. AJA081-3 TaxID=2752316 RepID=UPI001AE0CE9D|nr:thioesterase family protein [Rhodoferax sp. AJA081-3]QTN29008.1 thioesterase family protein [Rhodoferax sp. AJA081-3]
MSSTTALPAFAYAPQAGDTTRYQSTELTRGPWHPDHQHAGPPIALVCGAFEAAAQAHGLTHIARLTANLIRPVPIGELQVQVTPVYVGRNAGHFSAQLLADGKEVGMFTALAQRENAFELPEGLPGHPLPMAPRPPEDSPVANFPFAGRRVGYSDLVETRTAQGRIFDGPCAIWFCLRHPLLDGHAPSAYQRVAVAADSGNGISAVLDYERYSFVNSDLTVHLLRPPVGEWVCLDARTWLGDNGCGLAESALYDAQGLIGRSTQSLAVKAR